MIVILIRTAILYLVVLLVVRVMGKSELSKMSAFQLVVILMIAELAAIPIESPDVSIINGAIAIFTLFFLQILFSLLSIKSERFKNFVNGRPSILIEKGQINIKELKKERININDLLEQLRIGNSPSLADVEYAVMESNGQLSIIPKADKKPLTAADMQINKESEIMPLIFISDGVTYEANLRKLGITRSQLQSCLLTAGMGQTERIFFAFCDEKRRLHVYSKHGDGKASEVIICDLL